jgi:hypothetical protein
VWLAGLTAVASIALAIACGGNTPNQASVTSTPIAQATPTPTPTPVPTPTPGFGLGCGLSAMPECGGPEGPPGVYGCCRRESITTQGAGRFTDIINQAIDILQEQRPDLFRGRRVLDQDAYMKGVARVLEERFNVCAKVGGPADEIGVKTDNQSSEQYDILLGNLDIRPAAYQVTCRPARF